jgi:hypothetical protein
MIHWLGSIGMGMVWGWLAGMTGYRAQPSWPLASCLAGATLIVLAEIVWMLGWPASYAFLGATLLACIVYLSWMRALRRRVSNIGHTGPGAGPATKGGVKW